MLGAGGMADAQTQIKLGPRRGSIFQGSQQPPPYFLYGRSATYPVDVTQVEFIHSALFPREL